MTEKDSKASGDTVPSVEPAMRIIAPTVKQQKGIDDFDADFIAAVNNARNEYFKMYEEDPATWQKLTFGERFDYLIKRLAAKGILFADEEKSTLRSILSSKHSTKMMWVTEAAVDAHDGPDNPARIADEAKRAAAAAAAEGGNSEDSQEAV